MSVMAESKQVSNPDLDINLAPPAIKSGFCLNYGFWAVFIGLIFFKEYIYFFYLKSQFIIKYVSDG